MVKLFDDLYSKGNAFYKALPPMREGAIKSFIVSSAFTAVLLSNPTAAIMSGATGALASLLSSLAKPIFEKHGMLNRKEEFSKRLVIINVAQLILSGGKTTVRQILLFSVMSAASVLQKEPPFSQAKSDETFFYSLV